ncbi:MAG: transcriptional regulator [Pyrobaculum sp.]|jgi:DNA-binding transcriptional ArsR family regulator
MKYTTALLAVVVLTAAVSLLLPRLAPIALRVGAVAALIIAALWIYEVVVRRPPRLAYRVYSFLKSHGPLSLGYIIEQLGEDPAEVEKALAYLTERGLVRRFEKGGGYLYEAT